MNPLAFISSPWKLFQPPNNRLLSPRKRSTRLFIPHCLVGGPTADYYREAENLDDPTSNMDIWNHVIHASLKRKLSNLPNASPHSLSSLIRPTKAPSPPHIPQQFPPVDVVTNLLSAFKQDALRGANMFVQVASERNHVKRSTPERLVLFVGDNDSYRLLLRVNRFVVERERFGGEGECVVRAQVWGSGEEAAFDFMMVYHKGEWLIDEVFRLS